MRLDFVHYYTVFNRKIAKVPPSPIPSTPKAGNYAQYHGILDVHKQNMADGERNMDEWNKGEFDLIVRSMMKF